MYANLDQLISVLHQFDDLTWDPGLSEYRDHLAALNAVVADSGETPEGSLFFLNNQVPSDVPQPEMLNKRRNYAAFALSGSRLLEIGFNAGHSCLLALTMNKELDYTGVDLGNHAYARPCFEYLKSTFGERVRVHFGDSREVLPVLRAQGLLYDLVHVDGGHGWSVMQADLLNAFDLCRDGSALMMDDTDDSRIDKICDLYSIRGLLSRIRPARLWSEAHNAHSLFRVHKR